VRTRVLDSTSQIYQNEYLELSVYVSNFIDVHLLLIKVKDNGNSAFLYISVINFIEKFQILLTIVIFISNGSVLLSVLLLKM
jgi:hypothetical protein